MHLCVEVQAWEPDSRSDMGREKSLGAKRFHTKDPACKMVIHALRAHLMHNLCEFLVLQRDWERRGELER